MLTLAATCSAELDGPGAGLLQLTRHLPGDRVLACPEGGLAARARSEGLSVIPVAALPADDGEGRLGPASAASTLLRVGRDLRRLAGDVRADLLIAWDLLTGIAAPPALLGRGRRPGLVFGLSELPPSPWLARAALAAAARSSRVVVPSRALARELDPEDRLGERLAVVPPGIDLARYDGASERAPQPEVLLLDSMGREAVDRAAESVPGLRSTSVDAASLDPREAIGRAWCVLRSNDRTAFDAGVLQALASGRPVVAPAGGAAAEIVDRDCGRLYPPGDARAAAAALVEVLTDPELAQHLSTGARARATWFEAEEASRRFAQLALETVGAPGRQTAQSEPRAHPAAHGMRMALVTVMHNSAQTIQALLRSAERHLPGAQVIVVDSGSTDDGPTVARTAAPHATVVELGENVGFGRASNAGLARVDRPVTVLINPDCELIDASLADLASDLLSAGAPDEILAPLVLSADGSRQDTVHLDPASPLWWLQAVLPPAALPAPLRERVQLWRSRKATRVGWAVGACLVAGTETLRRLGPFDERIFLFSEDLDLGLRAADAGVPTMFRPDARVVHLDAHSTDAAFGGEPFELLERQRRNVIGERRGPTAAARDDRIWLTTYRARILLKRLTGRSAARERLQLAALRRVRGEPPRLGDR